MCDELKGRSVEQENVVMQSSSIKHMVVDITKSESNNLRIVFQGKKKKYLANNLPLKITSGGVCLLCGPRKNTNCGRGP
jgi:hypothetical protein